MLPRGFEPLYLASFAGLKLEKLESYQEVYFLLAGLDEGSLNLLKSLTYLGFLNFISL